MLAVVPPIRLFGIFFDWNRMRARSDLEQRAYECHEGQSLMALG